MRMPWSRRSSEWYFLNNDGRLMHKWMHYFPIYDEYIGRYAGQRVTLLEIGVSHGGSLQLWRNMLGPRATIVGLDIDERVRTLGEQQIETHVGSQSDPTVLDALIRQYGAFDIVIDDGGHIPSDQITSIEHLWPYVKNGGIYLVEDLHTSYWPEYGSARQHPANFMSWTAARVDDMHAWHSREPDFEVNDWTRSIGGIHLFDSVAVFEKRDVTEPVHKKTGVPSFDRLYGFDVDEMIDDEHAAQLQRVQTASGRRRRLLSDPRGLFDRARRKVARRLTGRP